ncbi:unnamed protein product [Rhizophagus irregularis]|nr:unnamed protein product [Rhizophagus irregularis]
MVATTTQPTQITLCFNCLIVRGRRKFFYPLDKYYNVSYTVCFFNKKIRCLISEHKSSEITNFGCKLVIIWYIERPVYIFPILRI